MPTAPSRRLFLAAGSSATVFGSLSAAAAASAPSDDPIFAAIQAHRLERARFEDACDLTDEVRAEQEGRVVTADDEAKFDAASRAEEAALERIASTRARTAAGFVAALKYLVPYADEGDCLARFIEKAPDAPTFMAGAKQEALA